MMPDMEAVHREVSAHREAMVILLRELVAIPTVDSRIEKAAKRVGEAMGELGFAEIFFDRMGNLVGKIGDGPRTMLYDSHLDTVGIGNPGLWRWDPFVGKVENGVLYARGACDEKGSTPPMIYGLSVAHRMGLLEGWTAYYFGNMEEWCEGLCGRVLVEMEGIRPDFVVIGEPTDLRVARGQKGRVELKVTARGESAHAAFNELGDNAVYKLLPVLQGISELQPTLPDHPFVGPGRISVTDMNVVTASINAVPEEATAFVDRRLTWGETAGEAVRQVRGLVPEESVRRQDVTVEILTYDRPFYTGFVLKVDKEYPSWLLEESHPLVEAGQKARTLIGLEEAPTVSWDFSTNGVYWAGRARIPCIGFGPGKEEHAHTRMDSVRLEDVVKSAVFYAVLPSLIPGD